MRRWLFRAFSRKTPDDAARRIAAGDVENCYRIFLGRHPDSPELVANVVKSGVALWDYVEGVFASDECRGRLQASAEMRAYGALHRNEIDVEGDPEQIVRLFARVRQVWDGYGEADPYWSVSTDDAFRAANIDDAATARFFETGRENCDVFIDFCDRNGVAMPTGGTIIDFGCGVARMGVHLARRFKAYVGVDISASHLSTARRQADKAGLRNCRFSTLPEFLDERVPFDAFLSLIVLQHNPPPVMKVLLNTLLSRLAPGGIGFFQLPCLLFGYRFKLEEYLANPDNGKSMEMHALPHRVVHQLIADNGCRVIELLQDGLIGGIGLSYTFLVRKDG